MAVVLEDFFFYNYIWLIVQFGQIWGREGAAWAPSCMWATCWQSLYWRTWSAACRRTSWVPGSTGAGPGKQQTVSFGGFFWVSRSFLLLRNYFLKFEVPLVVEFHQCRRVRVMVLVNNNNQSVFFADFTLESFVDF